MPIRAAILLFFFVISCSNSRDKVCQQTLPQAKTLYDEGDWAKALALLQPVATIAPASCQWPIRLLLTEALIGQRQIPKALEILGETPPPASEPEQLFRYSLNRGFLYASTKQRKEAQQLFDSAAQIASANGRKDWQASVAQRKSLLTGSEQTLLDGLELARQSGSARVESEIRLALGFSFLRAERLSEAELMLMQAARLANQSRHFAVEYRARLNLGPIYLREGEYLRALEELSFAEKAARERGLKADRVRALHNIGNAQYFLQHLDTAISYQEQALQVARESNDQQAIAEILYNLAAYFVEKEDFDKAEKAATEMLQVRTALNDPEAEVKFEFRRAQIERGRGKLKEAEVRLNALLKKKAQTGPWFLWSVEQNLADIAQQQNQPVAAEKHFREALRVVHQENAALQSASTQMSFTTGNLPIHQQFVRFLASQGQSEQALEIAQWARATSPLAAPPKIAKQQLIRAAAARKGSLLVYSLGPIESFAWVATPSRFAMVKLPPEKEVRELVQRYEKALQTGTQIKEIGTECFDRLIAPALTAEERKGQIWLIPDGILNRVNPEGFLTNGSYWMEQASCIRISSLEHFLNLPKTLEKGHSALLIGDAEQPSPDFPKLPNSATELQQLSNALQPLSTTVLKGKTATVDSYTAAKPESFDYIHFSTHAIADQIRPEESALILSPSSKGFRLKASEVSKLKITASVVTLGACHSTGDRIYSAGMIGLASAFLSSGAANVIASLRDVDDEASRQLSVHLYKFLIAGLQPADALAEAKRKLIADKKFGNPIHWGAWVVLTAD